MVRAWTSVSVRPVFMATHEAPASVLVKKPEMPAAYRVAGRDGSTNIELTPSRSAMRVQD